MKKRLPILLILFFSFFIGMQGMQAQGVWVQKASLPAPGRGYGIGFSIGNYGYVGLGGLATVSQTYNDLWRYDPNTNTWTQMATFPGKARICPATFVIGHNAYVITGANDINLDTCYAECWMYNDISNTWTKENNFPGVSRASASGFAIGANGYLTTGMDSAYNVYNDVWEYDTTTDSWTKKNNFPGGGRFGCSAFAANGKGYLCFGSNQGIMVMCGSIWAYDPSPDTWTYKDSITGGLPRYGASGFVIDTDIYIGMGSFYSTYLNDFWKYSSGFTQITSFAGAPRAVCSSFSINGHGYVCLGNERDSAFFNDLYEFYPDSTLGISEIKSNDFISIYPNPFSESCNIVLSQNKSGCLPVFTIYNMMGKKMKVNVLKRGNSTYTMKRDGLPTGIYILSVSYNHQSIYKKLIINNSKP